MKTAKEMANELAKVKRKEKIQIGLIIFVYSSAIGILCYSLLVFSGVTCHI